MIITKELKTTEDFESLKPGDKIACEFRPIISRLSKEYQFNVFTIVAVKKDDAEIILQKKGNIYFNYRMALNGNGILKSAVLIECSQAKVTP